MSSVAQQYSFQKIRISENGLIFYSYHYCPFKNNSFNERHNARIISVEKKRHVVFFKVLKKMSKISTPNGRPPNKITGDTLKSSTSTIPCVVSQQEMMFTGFTGYQVPAGTVRRPATRTGAQRTRSHTTETGAPQVWWWYVRVVPSSKRSLATLPDLAKTLCNVVKVE